MLNGTQMEINVLFTASCWNLLKCTPPEKKMHTKSTNHVSSVVPPNHQEKVTVWSLQLYKVFETRSQGHEGNSTLRML